MTIRFLSVCSGIEAASVAWHSLGWQCAGLSEIEAFPRAVLEHRQGAQAVDWDHRHTPQSNSLPLFGDFTQIESHHVGPIDLLVGGTPCQSFSIAGLRGGLDDDRGNLALEFLRLADRTRPRWVVWENVPGVLSSNGGRDFGAILGGLVELGYGFAYRVLDAQHFGVPQRRRRVFVVGHLGSWTRAAAVLFERHSLQGHSAPRREAGKEIAGTLESRASGGGGGPGGGTDGAAAGYLQPVDWPADTAPTLNVAFTAKDYGADAMDDCSPTLRAGGFTDSHQNGGVMPAVAYAIQERAVSENPDTGPDGAGFRDDGAAYTLEARSVPQAVAFALRGREGGAMPEIEGDQVGALRAASGGSSRSYVAATAVRRLTPRECERLQGFPDDYTMIPWRKKPADQCPDGPRYKALGNSMAVPCMAWIGERIAAVEAIINREEAA